MDFKQRSLIYRQQADAVLDSWLSASDIAPRLIEAMRYSVFNGGKRVRPILVYAAADAISELNTSVNSATAADSAAAAVECIHAYSLIHDDLPAMDDDDLRRGKATCHIQFDEATAILAGDALQAMAFTKLAESDIALAPHLILALGRACGAGGMVGGQMLDLLAEGKSQSLSITDLERVHVLKTGALIRASVKMGAICAGANDAQLAAMTSYADSIGLAFQVQDDIIDVCSDTETLGKQQGADIERGKSTYVSLLGLNAAQEKAQILVQSAKSALSAAHIHSPYLNSMADYIIARPN